MATPGLFEREFRMNRPRKRVYALVAALASGLPTVLTSSAIAQLPPIAGPAYSRNAFPQAQSSPSNTPRPGAQAANPGQHVYMPSNSGPMQTGPTQPQFGQAQTPYGQPNPNPAQASQGSMPQGNFAPASTAYSAGYNVPGSAPPGYPQSNQAYVPSPQVSLPSSNAGFGYYAPSTMASGNNSGNSTVSPGNAPAQNLPAGEIKWQNDLQAAQRAAAQYQVPLLLHFYSDNCLPCATLEQKVYTSPEIKGWLNKRFICVKIHGGQDRGACAMYNVIAFPTDVFIAADGTILYHGISKQDPALYLEVLQQVAVKNRDRNAMLATNRNPIGPSTNPFATPRSEMANTMVASQTMIGPTSAGAAMTGPAQTSQSTMANVTAGGIQTGVLSPTGTLTAAPNASAIRNPQQVGPLTAANQAPKIESFVPREQMQVPPANGLVMSDPQAGLPPLPANIRGPMQGGSLVNNGFGSNDKRMLSPPPGVPAGIAEVPATATAGATNVAVSKKAFVKDEASGLLVSNPYYQDEEEPIVCTPDGKCGPASQILGQTAGLANTSTHLAISPKTPIQPISARTPESDQSTQTVAASSDAAKGVSNEEPALEGYCPVTFVTSGQRVRGVPEFVVRHRGRNYWMQSAQAAQQFLQKPDTYSPMLSGYDPMVFLIEGKLVDGKTEYAMQDPSTSVVVLFSSSQSRDQFKNDQENAIKALRLIRDAASKP